MLPIARFPRFNSSLIRQKGECQNGGNKKAKHAKKKIDIENMKLKIQLMICLSAGIHLLKVNNRNTRTKCDMCSKLTIKTLKRRQS